MRLKLGVPVETEKQKDWWKSSVQVGKGLSVIELYHLCLEVLRFNPNMAEAIVEVDGKKIKKGGNTKTKLELET